MPIRPFISADAPHLAKLLGQIWGSEPCAHKYYRFGPDSPPDSPGFVRTLVAEEDGAPVGFGSTAHQDEPDRLSLGWRGVAEDYRHNERDLILSLTRSHISHAAGLGAKIIAGEFDTTDPWAMMQLGAFPFQPAPCWLTFQRSTTKSL